MNLIYLLLAAVDLAGVFFNIRMLRTCFKDKTKNTFLQRSRMVAIWQVACQATILGMDAVELWNGLDVQPRDSCNVFRVSLGIIGSVITWWYSCGSQEILSQKAVKVMAVVCVAFVVFLTSSALRNNTIGLSEDITTEASMDTCPSLFRRAYKYDKKLIFS